MPWAVRKQRLRRCSISSTKSPSKGMFRQVARVYVGLGDRDKALEWLERSRAERSLGLGDVGIKVNPVFDPLRSDPRFARSA